MIYLACIRITLTHKNDKETLTTAIILKQQQIQKIIP